LDGGLGVGAAMDETRGTVGAAMDDKPGVRTECPGHDWVVKSEKDIEMDLEIIFVECSRCGLHGQTYGTVALRNKWREGKKTYQPVIY